MSDPQLTISVLSMTLPVIHVDLQCPCRQELQLLGIKVRQEVNWHDFRETLLESLHLLGHAPVQTPFHHQVDVLIFVVLGNGDVIALWLQLMGIQLAKSLLQIIIQISTIVEWGGGGGGGGGDSRRCGLFTQHG